MPTVGTGKIFHTEEGGSTPPFWVGPGLPPNQDPPSWNASMSDVNAVAPMRACAGGWSRVACAVDATEDGEPLDGSGPFCDKVIADDAVAKLRLAAARRPFLVAVGLRKPHTPWRYPSPFLGNQSDVAAHGALDPSVAPIALSSMTTRGFQADPFSPLPRANGSAFRRHYYAATAWMDSQLGRVLDALDATGLASSTLVVLHGDHGWSLGEHGAWQKFTEWEAGLRVPLIVADPTRPATHGKRSSALVELVDVFPTMAELAGAPLDEAVDGRSFAAVLDQADPWNATAGGRAEALAEYPRCPSDEANASDYWRDNVCEFVERSRFFAMGASLRVDSWRYTEWRRWLGAALEPDWSPSGLLARELYGHGACDGASCFDDYENANEAADRPDVVGELAARLRRAYDERVR